MRIVLQLFNIFSIFIFAFHLLHSVTLEVEKEEQGIIVEVHLDD